MTIVERAVKLYKLNRPYDAMYANGLEDGYIKGATEQREIDIQRAVVWLKEKCYDDSLYSFDIDEFEQAMKGKTK